MNTFLRSSLFAVGYETKYPNLSPLRMFRNKLQAIESLYNVSKVATGYL